MTKAMSAPTGGNDSEVINILLVDDIVETRENIKKLLAFEPDFKVVGSVGTGREAVAKAKELRPDIIIMDINMPDMDGIQATNEITKAVPTVAVIMMSAQDDNNYLRKAMLAGARDFLTKPIDPDQMYGTIREVYVRNKPIVERYKAIEETGGLSELKKKGGKKAPDGSEVRGGHVILVYSPQGGAGTTTIATNLAAGLMRRGIKVLLIDTDVQFGDVGVFLKLQAQSNLVDLIAKVDDLDIEFFDTVIATHDTGLKVLLGPPSPEYADIVTTNPKAVTQMIEKVADNYDFIIIDTSKHLDDMLLSLMDLAEKIVLVATPTLAAIKNVRLMLDLFDKLNYPQGKTFFVLNRMQEERARQRITIPSEVIEKHLKRRIESKIPLDETTVLSAVNKGIPVIASQRDRSRSPIKELVELSDKVYSSLMGQEDELDELMEQKQPEKKRGLFAGLRLGKA